MTEQNKDQSKGNSEFLIEGDIGPGAAIGPNAQVSAQNIAGRDIITGANLKEVSDAFAEIYSSIEKMKFAKADDARVARDAVEIIEEENAKGNKASEKTVRLSLHTLAQMAPDIWEVAISTLTNPIQGISTVIRKVAEKAKADAEKKQ